MVLDYLKYFTKANNAHGIHSPFVFDLYTKVYKKNFHNSDFIAIETLRKSLKNDQRKLEITDFGAGSKTNDSLKRTVADISRKSLKSSFWGQFFYALIQHYNYTEVLELGTSLGITTSYLAKANPKVKVNTFEGCKNTIAIAKENFEELNLGNINVTAGNIDFTLPEFLRNTKSLDLVLFDANHRYEPTVRYFNLCYEKAHENSVFIMDDIYWSEEMKQAWNEIKTDPRVTITVDFFQIGLVFFREGKQKQDFVLR